MSFPVQTTLFAERVAPASSNADLEAIGYSLRQNTDYVAHPHFLEGTSWARAYSSTERYTERLYDAETTEPKLCIIVGVVDTDDSYLEPHGDCGIAMTRIEGEQHADSISLRDAHRRLTLTCPSEADFPEFHADFRASVDVLRSVVGVVHEDEGKGGRLLWARAEEHEKPNAEPDWGRIRFLSPVLKSMNGHRAENIDPATYAFREDLRDELMRTVRGNLQIHTLIAYDAYDSERIPAHQLSEVTAGALVCVQFHVHGSWKNGVFTKIKLLEVLHRG